MPRDYQVPPDTTGYPLIERVAETNARALKEIEDWLIANIQANYGMSDPTMISKVAASFRSAMNANIEYHKQLADSLVLIEPMMARQHLLLANLYKSIAST